MIRGTLNLNTPTWRLLTLLVFVFFPVWFWGTESQSGHPERKTPVREISQIGVPSQANPMLRVGTARILLADYGLIKKDFPFTTQWSNERIDAWLLDQTGYVSESQIKSPNGVNSAVATRGDIHQAYRPAGYGRGAVYPVASPVDGKPFGLIDAKGTGAIDPKQVSHGSGLMSAGEGLREFFYEKYVAGVLAHQKSDWSTVGTYAVIDWGFDEIHTDGSKVPAGAVLRQAHERVQGRPGLQYLTGGDARAVELSLREYGMTSTGDSVIKNGKHYTNLQGTTDQKLIDFGHFIQLPELPSGGTGNYGELQAQVLIEATDPDFVKQSHPEMKTVIESWGPYPGQNPDPKFDRISGEMTDLVRAIRDGRASRVDVAKAYYQRVEGSLQKVRATTPLAGTPAAKRAREEGQMLAAKRYLQQGSASGALSLARTSGLPFAEWAEQLMKDLPSGQMDLLGVALGKVGVEEDIELATQLAEKVKYPFYLIPIAEQMIPRLAPSPRRSLLIDAILAQKDGDLTRGLVFFGLKEDTSPDVLKAIVSLMSHPTALKPYSPPDLQRRLKQLKVWETLSPEVQRVLLAAAEVSGERRLAALAPLLEETAASTASPSSCTPALVKHLTDLN